MSKFLIKGTEMFKKVARKFGHSAAVYLPRRLLGKVVVVVVTDEEPGGLLNGEEKP